MAMCGCQVRYLPLDHTHNKQTFGNKSITQQRWVNITSGCERSAVRLAVQTCVFLDWERDNGIGWIDIDMPIDIDYLQSALEERFNEENL